MSDLELLLARLRRTSRPEDVFGSNPDKAKQAYHSLIKVAHVDRFRRSEEEGLAEEATRLLNVLWNQGKKKIEQGTYATKQAIKLKMKDTVYQLSSDYVRGDLCNVHRCELASGDLVFKIPRQSSYNKLLGNEYENLSKLMSADDRLSNFFNPVTSEVDVSVKGERRKINVFRCMTMWMTLEQAVLGFPQGIHALDMYWVWRRVLHSVGYAHSLGIVHGCLTPSNILMEPENHGLKLIDWCFAVPIGSPPLAIPSKQEKLLPHEVMQRRPLGCESDIYTAASTMMLITDPTTLTPGVRSYFSGCTLVNQSFRPHDAQELLEEFDSIIGPRRFRPFVVPTPE